MNSSKPATWDIFLNNVFRLHPDSWKLFLLRPQLPHKQVVCRVIGFSSNTFTKLHGTRKMYRTLNCLHSYQKDVNKIYSSMTIIIRGGLNPFFPECRVFTNSAPLGRVGHRVAMSVCVCVCLCALSGAVLFRPLIGPEITWSIPGLSLVLPPSLLWKLGNSVTR